MAKGNYYLACIVDGELDAMTFPNENFDPDAPKKCFDRACFLIKHGKHAYPAKIKEILIDGKRAIESCEE